MQEMLSLFYSKSYENEINELMLDKTYSFEQAEIVRYARQLIDIPVEEYIKWLDNSFSGLSISYEDAVQYSKLDDATDNIVRYMIDAGDMGYTHVEIGKLLQNDGVERTSGTDTKYGENHAKTAKYLGYLYSLNRYYYVSCLGYAYLELTEEERDLLNARLFLRTPLFRMVYLLSKSGNVSIKKLFDFLSDSTYKRRKNNIKTLFDMLKADKNYNWAEFFNKIFFE